jgi:mannitol-1-phosphate 5-dehydrogenase
VGRIFHEAGYHVSFVDVNPALIEKLNATHAYPLYVTMGDHYDKMIITDVDAIDGRDIPAICAAVNESEIAATAIGVNVLPIIARTIAAVIQERKEKGMGPFNFVLCENKINVHLTMKEYLKNLLDEETFAYAENNIGFCQSSIGCMVPAPPQELVEQDPLIICVENYNKIYTDAGGAIGQLPAIPNLIAYEPFSYYINRKLFMHNMSHCVAAYWGYQKGYTYIWEAISDPAIYETVEKSLHEVAQAMSYHYKTDKQELLFHGKELMNRYANTLLGDTIARVGGDPVRKLARSDRLVGAALFCLENGVNPNILIKTIPLGFTFRPEGDPSAKDIQSFMAEHTLAEALEKFCSLSQEEPLYSLILKEIHG